MAGSPIPVHESLRSKPIHEVTVYVGFIGHVPIVNPRLKFRNFFDNMSEDTRPDLLRILHELVFNRRGGSVDGRPDQHMTADPETGLLVEGKAGFCLLPLFGSSGLERAPLEFVFQDDGGVVIRGDVPVFLDVGCGHPLCLSGETFDAHGYAEVKGMTAKPDVDVGVGDGFSVCIYHGETQVSFSKLVDTPVSLLSPRGIERASGVVPALMRKCREIGISGKGENDQSTDFDRLRFMPDQARQRERSGWKVLGQRVGFDKVSLPVCAEHFAVVKVRDATFGKFADAGMEVGLQRCACAIVHDLWSLCAPRPEDGEKRFA